MTYSKPHLTFEQQVAKLRDRGLICTDEAAAVQLLKTVGYYRLSAYVYPFRELLAEVDRQVESPAHFRSDAIQPGVTFEHVRDLWKFDRALRLLCLDAIETIEIGLRTQVAYVLGERNPFGHLVRNSLNLEACSEASRREAYADRFEEWLSRYESLRKDALSEDFVKHNTVKYGSELPVWIAVEFLDFGALVRLYRLLDKADQTRIASSLHIKGGPLLGDWLRDMNYIRNLSAHHSRLWNRVPTYKPRKFNPHQVPDALKHAAQLAPRDKIYVHLAIMAFLSREIDPTSNWPLSLRTRVRKFPATPRLTVESDMGFPKGWDSLPVWNIST